MDILNGFFDKISWRLKKETNLSDITWALLSISECFKNVFLNIVLE